MRDVVVPPNDPALQALKAMGSVVWCFWSDAVVYDVRGPR
jgi:hypothetical protein